MSAKNQRLRTAAGVHTVDRQRCRRGRAHAGRQWRREPVRPHARAPPPPPPRGKPTPYADHTGYVPVNRQTLVAAPTPRDTIVDVEKWQPLTYADPTTGSAATPSFIAPHWKNVTPFALTSADQFRPSAPERYTSQAFLDQARHVIEVQANLTNEQKVIT